MKCAADAYMIGAQKAGTTTLADLLAQHPDIAVPVPKEPHYLTHNRGRGDGWYRDCFGCRDEALWIDCSTSYSMAPLEVGREAEPVAGVPERILKVSGKEAKFIYILRDPVARTWSAYWHRVRSGYEKRPFEPALEAFPGYIETSRYYSQAERYLEIFPRESFLFLDFHALSCNPVAAADACRDFLGLDAQKCTFVFDRPKNQSFQYSALGQILRSALGSHERMKRFAGVVKALVPEALHPLLKRLAARGIPPMDPATKSRLRALFFEENEKMKNLCGIDLNRFADTEKQGGKSA
jgi:hypothetical protein